MGLLKVVSSLIFNSLALFLLSLNAVSLCQKFSVTSPCVCVSEC